MYRPCYDAQETSPDTKQEGATELFTRGSLVEAGWADSPAALNNRMTTVHTAKVTDRTFIPTLALPEKILGGNFWLAAQPLVGNRDRGGQNVPNAGGGGGNSPRKLPLEDLDF